MYLGVEGEAFDGIFWSVAAKDIDLYNAYEDSL